MCISWTGYQVAIRRLAGVGIRCWRPRARRKKSPHRYDYLRTPNVMLTSQVIICSDSPRYRGSLALTLSAWTTKIMMRNALPGPDHYLLHKWLQHWPIADFEAFIRSREGRHFNDKPLSLCVNALIRMICFRYSVLPWGMRKRISRLGDQEYERCCQETLTQHQSAKMDLLKVEEFLARHENLTARDCEAALSRFRVVVAELETQYEEMSAGFERRSTLWSLDMTRLAIDESRSTIRCESQSLSNIARHA